MAQELFGIDLGGTKIEGAAIRITSGGFDVLERLREPTEKEKGYDYILSQIKKVIDQLATSTGIDPERIGIGHPGTYDVSTHQMKGSNTTCLNGRSLKIDLENLLDKKVILANDANCFALAEASLGIVSEKAPNAQVVFGVIMGTGVGGGLVINGQVLSGLQGICGEWGHSVLDPGNGYDCFCGKKGCVETIISGTALERYYLENAGEALRLKDILDRYNRGQDQTAKNTIERLIKYYGLAISNIINILDPDAVVIGGGVGNIDLLYTEGVKEIEKNVFNPELKTPILKPKLGDSAGVFGAAMLTT